MGSTITKRPKKSPHACAAGASYKKKDVTIRFISNLLADDGRVVKSFPYNRDYTIRKYLRMSGFRFRGMQISVNGNETKGIEGRLTIGDEIVISPKLEGPLIAIAAAIWQAALLHPFIAWATILSVGYSVYQSVAAQRIRIPSFNTAGDGLDEGANYTWDGVRTTADVGSPIPVIYGERVVGGNVLNEYVSTDGENSYLHTLLGVGWGELESVSLRRINKNTAANYPGWSLTTRLGTLDQAVIPNFHDSHNLIALNSPLTKDNAVIRTTDGVDVEAFEVHLNLPSGLNSQAADGNVSSWSVIYRVEYKLHAAGEYIDLGLTTITKRTRNNFKSIYRKDGLTAGEYDIRVTRTSDDPSDVGFPITNGLLYFERIDEISCEDEQIFPRVGLAAVDSLALEQLSGMFPDYELLVKGRKILTPDVMDGAVHVAWDDYYWDPEAECYKLFEDDSVLTWDEETFVTAYSANPIWCMYDLMTNRIFGAGHYITSSDNDIPYLVEQSQCCEEKVPDGDGGFEKRFRMDIIIDSQQKALDLIVQLCSLFRAYPFYSDKGQVKIVVEKPETPVQLFSPGNILEKSFSESWGSRRDIPNIVNVQFDDKERNYTAQTVQAIVDDAALIAGKPLNPQSIRYFGVGESYAIRHGRNYQKALKHISNTIKFRSALGSIIRQCGEVIDIAHDVPQWGFGGTVKADFVYKGDYDAETAYVVDDAVSYSGSEYKCILASTGNLPSDDTYWEVVSKSKVKLDRTVTIEAAKSYAVRVDFGKGGYEEKLVTDGVGSYTEVNVSVAFSKTPLPYDIYSFGEVDKVVKPGRIVSLTRLRNGEVEFETPEYNEDIFDDSAVVLPTRKYSSLSTDFPDVTDLVLKEKVVTLPDGTVKTAIEIWFTKPDLSAYGATTYDKAKIYYSDNGGVSWIYAGETRGSEFSITGDIELATEYTIAVVSVGIGGRENAISGSPQDTITPEGKTSGPATPTNFAATFLDAIDFTWDKPADTDVAGAEIRDEDNDWGVNNAHRIYLGQAIVYTLLLPPSRSPGTYYIKFFNTSGIYSEDPGSVVPTNDAPAAPSVAATQWFGFAKMEWTDVADVDKKFYEVYKSHTNAWGGEEFLETKTPGRAAIVQGNAPVDAVAASPDSTSITDTDLIGKGADYFVGDVIVQTSGTHVTQQAVVTAFNNGTGKVSVASWPSGTPDAGDEFVIKDRAHYKVRAVDTYGPGSFSSAVEINFTPLTEAEIGDAIISARKLIAGEIITLTAQIKDLVVTNAKIFDLNGSKIVAETITLAKLASEAIPPKTYYQDAEPGAGMREGDYWIDTNDSNKLYTYQSSAWEEISASAAGGVTIFRQPSIPTSTAEGDLWVDTDDGDKLYRAASVGADDIATGEWVKIDVASATGWTHSSDITKIDGGKIFTSSITADKINVSQLDAVATNTGTLTVDETVDVGDGSVVLDGPNNVIKVYDDGDNLRVELGELS